VNPTLCAQWLLIELIKLTFFFCKSSKNTNLWKEKLFQIIIRLDIQWSWLFTHILLYLLKKCLPEVITDKKVNFCLFCQQEMGSCLRQMASSWMGKIRRNFSFPISRLKNLNRLEIFWHSLKEIFFPFSADYEI